MTTTVQLRIDSATKLKAQKVLEKMGLDLSSGIKMFLTQVIRSKSIPFVVRTENGFTPAKEKELLREIVLTNKYSKRFNTKKEFLDDILG